MLLRVGVIAELLRVARLLLLRVAVIARLLRVAVIAGLLRVARLLLLRVDRLLLLRVAVIGRLLRRHVGCAGLARVVEAHWRRRLLRVARNSRVGRRRLLDEH